MIYELINTIATNLVNTNSSWLNEIRTIGYLNKVSETDYVTDDEVKEIGLTDVKGNSGYIRFQNDQNFRVEKIPAKVSDYAARYTYAVKLVLLMKTNVPVDLAYLLSLQLNHMEVANFGTASQIKVQVTGGGSNSVSITKGETGKELTNTNLRAIYLDLILTFEDNNRCDFTQKITLPDMNCNCTLIFDNGCIASCDTITLPIVSDYTGEAIVKTTFNGQRVIIPIEVTNGQAITIDSSNLNEDYTFLIEVYDENEEQITYTSGETTYDCFKVQIIPQ